MSCVRSAGLGAVGGFGKHREARLGAGLGAWRGPLGAERALGGGVNCVRSVGLGALGGFGKHTGTG